MFKKSLMVFVILVALALVSTMLYAEVEGPNEIGTPAGVTEVTLVFKTGWGDGHSANDVTETTSVGTLDILSRLKGIETYRPDAASSRSSATLDILSRLKGIETSISVLVNTKTIFPLWIYFPV